MNLTRNEAYKETAARRLVMYEGRQVLEYVKRKEFTNRYFSCLEVDCRSAA